LVINLLDKLRAQFIILFYHQSLWNSSIFRGNCMATFVVKTLCLSNYVEWKKIRKFSRQKTCKKRTSRPFSPRRLYSCFIMHILLRAP
jgi:hypothetical protein